MRVLAFRHVPFEDVGYIRPVLEARGIGIECVDLFRCGKIPPDAADTAGLIFMGGPMSANDDLPYLAEEIQLIREAVERGQPVLGVCLGSQLLARALGARVRRNPAKEIGWFPLHLTPEATEDRLFSGLNGPQTVFHWHSETFDLPHGAAWLAYSDACRHQAFRFGRSAYGFQFHAEVSPEMVSEWCLEDANCGDVRELSQALDPHAHDESQQELSAHLFGRWGDVLSG